MGRWLIEAPRWLLLGVLVYAPWAYGSTPLESIQVLNGLLGITFALWLVVCLLRRSWPAVPKVAVCAVGLLLGQAWFMVLNARSDYDTVAHEFIPGAQLVPGLAGSLHQSLSASAAMQVSALLAAFCMICDLVRFAEWRRRLLLTVALAGTSIALLGLVQRFSNATAIFWGNENMGQTFFATYRYHANAGAFLNVIWPIVAGFVALSFLKRAPRAQKIAWTAALVICLAAVFVNTSRAASALGVLLAGCWGLWGLWQVARGRLPGFNPSVAVVTGIILVGLIAGVASFAGMDSSLRRWGRFGLEVTDQNPRLLSSQVCLDMVPEAGWFGFGPGTFPTTFPYFTERFGDRLRGQWLNAHEDYLQTIIEWGYLGAVVWGVLILGGAAYALHRAFKHRESLSSATCVTLLALVLALAGVLVHAFVDFPLQIASIQLYVAVILGLFWGSRHWLRGSHEHDERSHRRHSHRRHSHRSGRPPQPETPAAPVSA